MSVVAEIAAETARWGEVAGNAFEEAYKSAETAEVVVEQILEAEARALDIEAEGSPYRWRVADGYVKLSDLGWTQQEIGRRFGKSQPMISLCLKCARYYQDNNRPLWPRAFDEALGRDDDHVSSAQLLTASDENEWYTPAKYIEAARRVLGEIDLDPASSPEANATVLATAFYTRADNGFTHDWAGRVWLNPPYGGDAGSFVNRLVDEFSGGNVTAAIALVNAHCTDTEWFQPLFDRSLCFTNHRIDFDSAGRDKTNSSTHGSVFAYFGDDDAAFAREFAEFGPIVRRI